MAQYFRQRPATCSSVPGSHLHTPSSSGHRLQNRSHIDIDNQMATSSILIFPNPPSIEDSLRSSNESQFEFSGSTPSLPTDVSLGSFGSRSRSRGEEARNGSESWRAMSRTTNLRDRSWSLLLPESESEWELDSGCLRSEYTGYSNSSRGHGAAHTRTSSNANSSFTRALPPPPQPPFRLPFLSFFQNFLTLDESTLHLISRSPDQHTSILFPVSLGSHPHPDSEEEQPAHDALKLLLYNPDKPKDIAMLKAGLDPSEVPADANPFLMNPTRIPVWRFLELVIEGGVRAWKEAKAWDAGDVKLMGV